jgi:hypothetical protein
MDEFDAADFEKLREPYITGRGLTSQSTKFSDV